MFDLLVKEIYHCHEFGGFKTGDKCTLDKYLLSQHLDQELCRVLWKAAQELNF